MIAQCGTIVNGKDSLFFCLCACFFFFFVGTRVGFFNEIVAFVLCFVFVVKIIYQRVLCRAFVFGDGCVRLFLNYGAAIPDGLRRVCRVWFLLFGEDFVAMVNLMCVATAFLLVVGCFFEFLYIL